MNKDSQSVSSHQLIVLLFQTRDLMFNVKRKELRKYGITFEELAVLIHINKLGDKATPVELSRLLLRKHHSITGLLLRMEKKGLIIRNKDLKKKNMIRVSMTEKGESLYQNTKKENSLNRMVDLLSIEQKQAMAKGLNILRDESFDILKIEDKPPLPV
jgi:MarR family transcriptional regulator, organic hydroperoxide resistance regulator